MITHGLEEKTKSIYTERTYYNMEYKEILLKFYKTNCKMIKHIMNADYYTDELKLKHVEFFRTTNIKLMQDIRKEIQHGN